MQREGTYTTGPSGRFSDSSNHTGKLASSEPRAQTDMEKEDLIQSNQHLQPSYLGLGIVLGMGVPQHSPALQELLVQWEGKTGTPPGATKVGQASLRVQRAWERKERWVHRGGQGRLCRRWLLGWM